MEGYGNAREYLRSPLREAKVREDDAKLEALLVEGLATGGDDIPFTREFWKDLRSEAMELARKHKDRKKSS